MTKPNHFACYFTTLLYVNDCLNYGKVERKRISTKLSISRWNASGCATRDASAISFCPKNCTSDADCNDDKNEKCTCYGECGFSCIDQNKGSPI
jgi:hypothetical protein